MGPTVTLCVPGSGKNTKLAFLFKKIYILHLKHRKKHKKFLCFVVLHQGRIKLSQGPQMAPEPHLWPPMVQEETAFFKALLFSGS